MFTDSVGLGWRVTIVGKGVKSRPVRSDSTLSLRILYENFEEMVKESYGRFTYRSWDWVLECMSLCNIFFSLPTRPTGLWPSTNPYCLIWNLLENPYWIGLSRLRQTGFYLFPFVYVYSLTFYSDLLGFVTTNTDVK